MVKSIEVPTPAPVIALGKVSFGRTVQPAPYESIRADVELPFYFVQGDEGSLNGAAAAAVNNVSILVESLLKKALPSQAPLPVATTKVVVTKPASPAEAKAPAPSAQAAVAVKEATPVQPPPPSAEEASPQQAAAARSDNELSAACSAKVAQLKGTEKVMALIQTFASGSTRITNIPKDKRDEFMLALEALS